MRYDNLHNITRKKQDIVQNGFKFGGILNAGYDLSYNYSDNSQQIANIADESYRYEGTKLAAPPAAAVVKKSQVYSYDANGNMIYVASGKLLNDSTLQATSTRKLLWDEENHLLAISDNGYVSNYWYDAAGERTVKESFGNEGVFVNGVLSGARTETGKFTAYVSPYLVVSNGGNYTKHIYMGSQRITSKVSNSGIFTSRNPLTDTTALNKSYTAKLASLTEKIKERFDSLGVVYNGTAQTGSLISVNPALTASEYFYHSDHLGSSSLITDGTGALVQHIEYVPFGETFIDERIGSWSTPYLFNGKEKDEETGLHYYGARYYDSRLGVWLSVDPLAEKYPNVGSYVYCADNPVKYVDPDGKEVFMFFAKKQKTEQRLALNFRNDKRIHIFSHGDLNGLEIYTNNGTDNNNITISNPGRFEKLMELVDSKLWADHIEGNNETQLEVVLHGCYAARMAEVLSEKYPDILFTGPDSPNTSVNDKEKGPYKIPKLGLFDWNRGSWKTYENGNEIKSQRTDTPFPINPLNGVEKPKDIQPYE